MARLGDDRYRHGAQGGDGGAGVCPAMGRLAPDRIVGVHVNAASRGVIPWPTIEGAEAVALLALDQGRLDRLAAWLAAESGYFTIQGTRPETLADGLTDSPAGRLAWIAEKFHGWTDPDRLLPEDAVDRAQLRRVALRYTLSHPAVSAVVPGMRTVRRVGQNPTAGDGRRRPATGGDGRRWAGTSRRSGRRAEAAPPGAELLRASRAGRRTGGVTPGCPPVRPPPDRRRPITSDHTRRSRRWPQP